MTEKEQQIREMAQSMCNMRLSEEGICGDGAECDLECWACRPAERLYDAGYRKQSEGEWKKRGNEKTCSCCKFIYYSNNDDWNYCPNCGAKMKGGI